MRRNARAAWRASGAASADGAGVRRTGWDKVYDFDMSCMKRLAMYEPLVDTVDANQVCTTSCLLRTFDIRTCTKADLSFTRPFAIHATRRDFAHALVVYFDVEFSCLHKSLWFSTGAHRRSPLRVARPT